MNELRVVPISSKPDTKPTPNDEIRVPSASPIYPRTSMLFWNTCSPPYSSMNACRVPSIVATATTPAMNVPNAARPSATPPTPPASFAASDISAIAPLKAIMSIDKLPMVSMDVCTSHISSTFAMATTRNPSNVTTPVMSATLPITSG